jgi:hypothetical protein
MSNSIPYFDLKMMVNSTATVAMTEKILVADISNNAISEKTPVKPLNRCGAAGCKRKLLLTDITCRCGIRCCMSHRDATQHDCKHDFRAESRQLLEKNLVKVTNDSLKNRL